MPDVEFTGERVIPGLVDTDLFNEHLARYRFARWFLGQRNRRARVLDAACGAGYGAQELPPGTSVVSVDIAADATLLARERGCVVVQASCQHLPFASASFDLITAFEMIEHLDDAGAFLSGARNVLRADGVLLVSTPNRAYYSEARGGAGPNPFHQREFTCDEFRAELKKVFPSVSIWTQNHVAGIVFAPAGQADETPRLEISATSDAAEAHFFLAACSLAPLPRSQTFAWMPGSGNVLWERERHIARLQGELLQKDQWREQLHEAHAKLQAAHLATEAELRARNLWAESLNHELAEARTVMGELERDVAEKLAWVRSLEADLAAAIAAHTALDQTLFERTDWARSLETEKDSAIAAYRALEADAEASMRQAALALAEARDRAAQHLRLIADSRWVRLGRKLGVGPEIGPETGR